MLNDLQMYIYFAMLIYLCSIAMMLAAQENKQKVIFKLVLPQLSTIPPSSVKCFYLFDKVINACSP